MSSGAKPQQVIARGVASNVLSFVIRFGAKAALLYVGANLFGKEAYGVYSVAVATVEIGVPLASLGLKRMVFPWLEEEAGTRGAPHVLLDALLLAALAGTLTALLIAGISEIMPGESLSDQLRLALVILAPAVMCQAAGDIALAATRWTHKMRYEITARGLVEPYVATIATAAAYYCGFLETGLAMGYWAGSLALAAYSVWSARHCLGPFNITRWHPARAALAHRARSLVPATGSDLVTALSQRIDLFLVGLLLGDERAGIYGVLRQLRTPIQQIRQAFEGILVPLIARTLHGKSAIGGAVIAAMQVILSIQLVFVILIVSFGHQLLGLFGSHYQEGYWVLVLLLVADSINASLSASDLVLYYRKPAYALIANIVQTIAVIALFPLLLPAEGLMGAPIALTMAAIVAAFLRSYWLMKLGVSGRILSLMPLFLAAFIGAAITAWLAPPLVSGGTQWPAALLASLAGLVAYGGLAALWIKTRPDSVSLGHFRILRHDQS